MTDIMQIRLLAMLDNEIEQVTGNISNEKVWALGATSEEDYQMHTENIEDFEEYKALLLIIRTRVEEGDLLL